MTVKELILELLECSMEKEVALEIDGVQISKIEVSTDSFTRKVCISALE